MGKWAETKIRVALPDQEIDLALGNGRIILDNIKAEGYEEEINALIKVTEENGEMAQYYLDNGRVNINKFLVKQEDLLAIVIDHFDINMDIQEINEYIEYEIIDFDLPKED